MSTGLLTGFVIASRDDLLCRGLHRAPFLPSMGWKAVL